LPVWAIRGATTVNGNTPTEIVNATKELLYKIVDENNLKKDDIISVIFSATKDLNAIFPAVAAREIGWNDVALMCTNEMEVPGSLKLCIRVLMHINTNCSKEKIKHVYLNEAKILRPDLA
jgi:chorismate mutase